MREKTQYIKLLSSHYRLLFFIFRKEVITLANWYCKVEGIIKKLEKLQDLDTSQVLQEVAQEGKNVVQANTANAGFPESSQATGVYNKGKNTIDVGFSGNWENYRALWVHNFGYRVHYQGFDGKTHFTGKTYTLHVGCWDEIRNISIERLAPVLKARMKKYIDQQIK